jgi:diguanylate cyclase (GGDEF)-like protein
MYSLLRLSAHFAAPAALLATAFVLVAYSAALPNSLAGLKTYGPYIVFVLGAALAIGFNRGRALLALATLIVAYAAQQAWLRDGLDSLQGRAIYVALTVFVPANLALLATLPERGALNRHGALRLAVIGGEALIVLWVVSSGQTGIVDGAWQRLFDPPPFAMGQMPQLGIVAGLLGLAAAVGAALVTRSAISAGCAGAIIAFAFAAAAPAASTIVAIFVSIAQLMVAVAVLQDTFRMAFRDELTGIPSRRALNERLAELGRTYTIAMIDVDHFKKFNDTYGHELGDQVLKMVAAHIAEVSGGGKAYRYGGEEFTVVFPDRDAAQALPHLEALRGEIEAYRLALRDAGRPRSAKGGKRERGGWRGRKAVSVTVSIGVAERNDRLVTPQAVIEAADRALYRAKDGGRNQVSR